MKKFKDGEIIYNVIKAHPKVEFFANSGVVHYNKQNHPAASSNTPLESVSLFDFPNKIYSGPIAPDFVSEFVINGNNLNGLNNIGLIDDARLTTMVNHGSVLGSFATFNNTPPEEVTYDNTQWPNGGMNLRATGNTTFIDFGQEIPSSIDGSWACGIRVYLPNIAATQELYRQSSDKVEISAIGSVTYSFGGYTYVNGSPVNLDAENWIAFGYNAATSVIFTYVNGNYHEDFALVTSRPTYIGSYDCNYKLRALAAGKYENLDSILNYIDNFV